MIADNKISNAQTQDIATLFKTGEITTAPPAELLGVLARIEALRDRPENWNGYDTAAPNPLSIEHAACWIQELFDNIRAAGGQWTAPHISADEDGNVALEWQRGKKILTAYVLPDEVEYIRAPGLAEEIENGDITPAAMQSDLWNWLTE